MSSQQTALSSGGLMCGVCTFYQSSIGKKFIMAITGVVFIGFVLGHLAGNLQIFLGAKAFNDYAAFLHSLGGLLWLARLVLIGSLLLHVVTAVQLRQMNKTARGKAAYRDQKTIQTSTASLYMVETGIVILLFIGLHLAHFTLGLLQPEFHIHDALDRDDVYFMVVKGFQNGPYVVLYCVAMLALGLHLRHGFWSIFQSLGLYKPELIPALKQLALMLGLAVGLLYASIPLSVVFGILQA